MFCKCIIFENQDSHYNTFDNYVMRISFVKTSEVRECKFANSHLRKQRQINEHIQAIILVHTNAIHY